MGLLASISGIRIDCDRCGGHTASPDLTVEQLRRASGFVHADGREYCADCAPGEAAEQSPSATPA